MSNTNVVCLPVEIIRNTNLSPRARIVWAELSLLPKGAVGEFVVKQKELAKLLGICVSTLRRAVKALEDAGLIQYVGLFEKKYKKYVFTRHCEPQAKQSRDLDCCVAVAPRSDETQKLKHYMNRWGAHASLLLAGHKTDWQAQFPLLNGQEGRRSIDCELIAELLGEWRSKYPEADLMVFITENLKILSGEKIRPIPPMSNEAYLQAICEKEQILFEALGPEQGTEMLHGLAREWGIFKYEDSKKDPKTRPYIARAIQAV